jgi:hypothetical protein
LQAFEGALVTKPERDRGKILVNGLQNERRRRFTIAHELGHFLSPWHEPTSPQGFWCSKADLRAGASSDTVRHRRQEGEANLFAIEVLAPRHLARPFLAGSPNLNKALELADELLISREAACRRYMELHEESLAVVFSQNGLIKYSARAESFPYLHIVKGQPLPEHGAKTLSRGLSDIEVVDAEDWLSQPTAFEVTAQTLVQSEGWATTLLHATSLDDGDDDPIEDTAERFLSFNRRD